MIRSLLPVGQGAFYREVFSLEDGRHTIIYDCGSSTAQSIVEQQIKDEFKIGENEFVIRDYSLKDYGIKPGDVCLYNPERTDETVYFSAVEIDGCIFPADLNEDEEDPDKYCVCTNGAYWDFTIFKNKVKVLGEICAWRKADETEYRPFIEE